MPIYLIRVLTRELKDGVAFAMSPGTSVTFGTNAACTFKLNPLYLVDAKERHASVALADDGSHWIAENLVPESNSTPSLFVLVSTDKDRTPLAVDKRSVRLYAGDEVMICGRRFRLCREDSKADIEAKEAFEHKKAVRKAAALKAAETRKRMRKTTNTNEVSAN